MINLFLISVHHFFLSRFFAPAHETGSPVFVRLDEPERRVGLCGDATRALTQGPGPERASGARTLGPGILARKR